MMPELFMADAVGATGKPLIRVHTAGSVGGSTAIVAASLVQSGKYQPRADDGVGEAVGVQCHVGVEHSGAVHQARRRGRRWLLRSARPVLHPARRAHRHHIGAMVAVKDRLNGAKNPLAHLHQPDITLEKVMESQMLWDPIRYDETCPSSDGACAMVIGNEEIADAHVAKVTPSHGSTQRRCAPNRWRTRAAIRSTRRPVATPRRRCGATRASRSPSTRSTSPRCTCRSPGSSRCGWKPRLRARRRGLEAHRGRRNRDRRAHPVQSVRRRAVVQSHWCVGHDPVRRVRDPGHGQGRRSPGRGRAQGARPRVRRRLAVLLDVGGFSADKP